MNRRTSIRPSLEVLEDRCCPSANAWLSSGTLTVTDNQSAGLAISEYKADVFAVSNNGNQIGTYHVTNGINVRLSGSDNSVDFYLEGYATPGSISVYLQSAVGNEVSVNNGVVRGNLDIYGGKGTDSVVLGGPDGSLQVNGDTVVQLNGGASDALLVNSGVTLEHTFTASSANNLTLAAGSTVGRSVLIDGGPAGNTVELDGTVGGLARFTGSMQKSDAVTVGQTAQLGSLVVLFGDGDSTLTMNGSVLDEFFMQKGIGSDTITLDGSIGGFAELQLGGDSSTQDTLDIAGTIGGSSAPGNAGNALAIVSGATGNDGTDTVTLEAQIKGKVLVNTGAGNDSVTFADALNIEGSATVNLGAGNDVFTLAQGARFQSATINGGSGTNTFNGEIGRVTAHGFQIINP
jgi:hypothetical protein